MPYVVCQAKTQQMLVPDELSDVGFREAHPEAQLCVVETREPPDQVDAPAQVRPPDDLWCLGP